MLQPPNSQEHILFGNTEGTNMANKPVLYNIYSDLVNAMKNVVPAKDIRLKDRPKLINGDAMTQKMAVIDLPLAIRDYVAGNNKTLLETEGVIYVFVQSKKDDTLDVTPMGTIVDDVVNLFPIKGEYCVCTNPEPRLLGSDGTGFQVTMITFSLRCRWNIFSNQLTNHT